MTSNANASSNDGAWASPTSNTGGFCVHSRVSDESFREIDTDDLTRRPLLTIAVALYVLR